MPEGSVPLLVALIVLIFFSAFFSSTETAYSCANRIKLRSMHQNGNKRAGKVLDLTENNYDKFISTILVGNNIVNITAATIATLFFALVLKNSSVDSSFVSTIVMTVAVLIFGEVTPKFLAKTSPEKFAMFVHPVIMAFYYIFYPINLIFSGWKWLLSKIFRIKQEDVITEDEILTMVEEAEEDGTLREEETELIRQVIEFDDVEVGDILVPRVNIVGVEKDTPMEEIKDILIREGYSRIPVYKDKIDTIIGTIHEKDFFKIYLSGKKEIDSIIQTATYTTEHVKISALLKQLQKKKVQIAVVLDEYGGTLGIVTMEDILEELVGEIWDEHDEEVEYFKKVDEDVYLVDGNAPLHETFKFFEMDDEIDNFEANTTSGWVVEKLGFIPRAGTKFEHLNLDIEVLKSTVKKVLQIKVTVKQVAEDEEN